MMMGDNNELKAMSVNREVSLGSSLAGVHILSQKVSRALELRTDTSAMASALDALAYLSSSTSNTSAGPSTSASGFCNPQHARVTMVDSKLVRSIMEKDALNQALLYQTQLKSLLNSVAEMKRSIANVSSIVASVQSAIEMDVCCAAGGETNDQSDVPADIATRDEAPMANTLSVIDQQHSANTIASSEGTVPAEDSTSLPVKDSGDDDNALSSSDNPAVTSQSNSVDATTTTSTAKERKEKTLQAEQALAMKLHDAFVARDACRKRYETLNRFLEKFQMSEQENQLLQYFNFGQQTNPSHLSTAHHPEHNHQQQHGSLYEFDPDSLEGFQFLDTLNKVRTVREELSKTLLEDDHGGAVTHQLSTATEQLGATSALRMMEKLAQKQEMAYERLYHFLQVYLNLNNMATAHLHHHVPTSSTQQRQSILDRMSLAQQSPSVVDDDIMEERLVHPFTKRALGSLSHVPTFHSHCLEMIAGSRRAEVTRRFLLALTSGYDNLAPIEMRAHDPVNYVGDMLAFAFRTFSVESDLARGLFVDNNGSVRGPSSGSNEEEEGEPARDATINDYGISSISTDYLSSITKTPHDMVAHSMSGLARPLKSRILQVVSSLSRRPEDEEAFDLGCSSLTSSDKDGAVNQLLPEENMEAIPVSARNRLAALYSLCGLLLFYQHQMGKTLERLVTNSNQRYNNRSEEFERPGLFQANGGEGEDMWVLLRSSNPLIQATMDCLQEASESFVASLKVYGAMLKSYSSMTEESEAELAQAVVVTILQTRNASPGFEPYILSSNPDLASALSLELLCNTVVLAAISSCLKFEDAVNLKDAVEAANKAGLSADCAEKWQAEIGAKEKDLVEDLVGKATGKMLYDCGLGPLAQALWNREMAGDTNPICLFPGLGQQSLQDGMAKFYASLYSPPFPNFDSIKVSSLKNSSRAMTAANVADTYTQIYDAAQDEGAGYDDLSFITHNPDQVKALLS